MKILITGGTGFVGAQLTSRFIKDGNEVTILTRSEKRPEKGPLGNSYLQGDPTQKGSWKSTSPVFFHSSPWIHGEMGVRGIRIGHP